MRRASSIGCIANFLLLGSCQHQLEPAAHVEPGAVPEQHTPGLAKWIGTTRRKALWSQHALLGVLDLETGQNALVVAEPNRQDVVCAASSDDGELLATLSFGGSIALWDRKAKLLSKVLNTGYIDRCYNYFSFAPATQRVLVNTEHGLHLLGPGLAHPIPVKGERRPALLTFSPDGRRIVVSVSETSVNVLDAANGKILRQLSASNHDLGFSPEGEYFTLPTSVGSVGLYDTASLELIQTIPADSAQFRLDMLIASHFTGEPRVVTAYSLKPFAQVWQRRGISVFGHYPTRQRQEPGYGPWLVGTGGQGWSVFDGQTGATLGSWPSSRSTCTPEWVWHEGTLVFVDHHLLTFWRRGVGASTHQARCFGAPAPIFSELGGQFIALDSLWDGTKRRRKTRIQLAAGDTIWGFSHDERFILGESGDQHSSEIVAWSTTDGRVVWRIKPAFSGLGSLNGAWLDPGEGRVLGYLDETNGKTFWVGMAIAADGTAVPLIFDDECWAGPSSLPPADQLPSVMPKRNCPELRNAFYSKLAQQRVFARSAEPEIQRLD